MGTLRLLAGLACALLAALAQPRGAAAQAQTPELAFEVVPLLSQVVGSSLLELNGYQDRLELGLPVPVGGRLVSAELRLNFVNSRNLDVQNSRVSAEINGNPLGDIPLRNDGELSRVTLRLPTELFKPAGNRLVFTSELRTPGTLRTDHRARPLGPGRPGQLLPPDDLSEGCRTADAGGARARGTAGRSRRAGDPHRRQRPAPGTPPVGGPGGRGLRPAPRRRAANADRPGSGRAAERLPRSGAGTAAPPFPGCRRAPRSPPCWWGPTASCRR